MPTYIINYRQTEYRTARIKADSLETALDEFVQWGNRGEDWFDSADNTEILSAKKEEE